MTVRDKLWLFASRSHDDDIYLLKGGEPRLTKWSRITPAEGALMLDVPNVIMINSDGVPAPYSGEAYGYMESFCRMKNVVWSITGSSGFRHGNEEDFICTLAEKYPNVVGAFSDDFRFDDMSDEDAVSMIANIRKKLDKAPRKLDMWLTTYTHQLKNCNKEAYKLFDNLTMWTWNYHELDNLKENFEILDSMFPEKKNFLGVYLLDYPSGKTIPDEYMKLQCEFGLEQLKKGKIEGMIFLTNCVMGIGLKSEYWLRDWIDSVKNIEL